VAALSTLLAAAADCDQQDAADKMVDLAKTLNNDADMIRLAQIFVQQPRNTVRSPISSIIHNINIYYAFINRTFDPPTYQYFVRGIRRLFLA
jgi:hypothetical protein